MKKVFLGFSFLLFCFFATQKLDGSARVQFGAKRIALPTIFWVEYAGRVKIIYCWMKLTTFIFEVHAAKKYMTAIIKKTVM